MRLAWPLLLLALSASAVPVPARAELLCGTIPDVMILLDRSGSMKEEVGAQSKAAIAKAAVQDLLQQFSGQIAFGATLFPRWPHVQDCSTAQVNVAPSVTSSSSILGLLNSNYPKGNTPIAASLDQVGAYMKASSPAPRYVVLITDGKETCLSPPAPLSQPGTCAWNQGTNYRKCGGCGWQFCLPDGTWSNDCEGNAERFGCTMGQVCQADGVCSGTAGAMTAQQAAQKLSAEGTRTYVVGFGSQVDSAALGAIAAAGGTLGYYQANNSTQLKAALSQIAGAISCCGNGEIDPGELCDTAIPPGQPGACPTSCDDGNPCTTDALVGTQCQTRCEHTPITQPKSGDGCCPPGATHANDSDCPNDVVAPELCGNGVLDPGERCDTAIPPGQPGSCSINCEDNDPCTRDVIAGVGCDVHCVHLPVQADPGRPDGCCPPGMDHSQDADCLPLCTPDRTENCIDPCQGAVCPDGQYCAGGQCVPWPQTGAGPGGAAGFVDAHGGCDCRTAGGDATALPVVLGALGLLLLGRGRRRR